MSGPLDLITQIDGASKQSHQVPVSNVKVWDFGFLIELRLHPDWGQKRSGFREKLREDLFCTLSSVGNQPIKLLNDLRTPGSRPLLPGISYSISHSPDLGGWASLVGPSKLGFDIELIDRPSRKVLDRVSSPLEVLQAPSVAALWCAKEAVFKALDGRPQLLSNIRIQSWKKNEAHKYFFQAATMGASSSVNPISGEGLFWVEGPYGLAIFIKTS